MAILYVASEGFELEPFAGLLTGVRKLNWPIDYAVEGVWESRRLILVANGAGPRLAGRAVETALRAFTGADLSASKLESVISTGLCGALVPELREGQIITGTSVLDLNTNRVFNCAPVFCTTHTTSGQIVTQDRIANNTAEKQRLGALGAIAVDMEASTVAARAGREGLPFVCIKVVSDRLDESFAVDLNQMRTTEGHIARGKIVLYTATHPKVIPELLRLRRRVSDAARVLGDFLVSCRINSERDGDRFG